LIFCSTFVSRQKWNTIDLFIIASINLAARF